MEKLYEYTTELIEKAITRPKIPNVNDQIVLELKDNLKEMLVIIQQKQEVASNSEINNDIIKLKEILNIGNNLLEKINNFMTC